MPVTSNVPTIFGEVFERDVTFCVDTSGSMFNCLHVVKEQLVETLMKHAQRDGETSFNIIEFNSEVTQWADKMVSCTPETVQVASEWIRKLQPKTGTNTMDALLSALQDNACRAVYLVTDGLPDTFAEEILDTVIDAAQGRAIHCIYLTGDKAEPAAVEFLEDLAVESFGSFHIASLTTHGCVERITPIYRAEHGRERVIRTVNNTLRPNFRTCSMSTTLQIDPDEILGMVPRSMSLGSYGPPPCNSPWWSWRYWGLGMFPYRYNFPNTWSRYRPAKSWLRSQDKLVDIPDATALSPSAGALLIGKKVLGRRIADGYFYMGTVQSQILEDKFLIAFGPCKHGKYRETTYQDTFVFDIVDYCDAQRHTIISGDHVLAPWEPEGEKYGPGIVIDGQERRQAIGPDDHTLTVAFSNGRTEKVAQEKAIWIPQPVYERVSLELKMPQETRSAIMTTDHYPLRNMPGYPASGSVANPPEYYSPENFTLEPNSHGGWDRWMYPEYLGYYPPYPLVLRRKQEREVTAAEEEDNSVIPGTDLTKKQLADRIQSQLTEYAEGSATPNRLLNKREKQGENTLKKSVTFNEKGLSQAYSDQCWRSDSRGDSDSGIASSPELEPDPALQRQLDMIEEERRRITRQRILLDEERRMLEEDERMMYYGGLDPDDPRLHFYCSKGAGKRPPWQYWRNDPAPTLKSKFGGGGGGGDGGGSALGPFRETALQAPLEARDQSRHPYIVEWTSPSFKYVDTFAKHDHSNTVEGCLKGHNPPCSGAGNATRSYNVSYSHPPTEEEKAEARKEYRRRRHGQRQMAWQERLHNEAHMTALMQDGHRERIQAQIKRDEEKQKQEYKMIANAREAKKNISKELKTRIEANQAREMDIEQNRMNSLRQRRERREAIESQREKTIEEAQKRNMEIKRQHCIARHNATTAKLEEEEARSIAVNTQHRNSKLNRVHHFHHLEDKTQAKKDLRLAVTEQHMALYRSQIFP